MASLKILSDCECENTLLVIITLRRSPDAVAQPGLGRSSSALRRDAKRRDV